MYELVLSYVFSSQIWLISNWIASNCRAWDNKQGTRVGSKLVTTLYDNFIVSVYQKGSELSGVEVWCCLNKACTEQTWNEQKHQKDTLLITYLIVSITVRIPADVVVSGLCSTVASTKLELWTPSSTTDTTTLSYGWSRLPVPCNNWYSFMQKNYECTYQCPLRT